MKFIKDSKEYLEFRRKKNEANRRYYSKPEVKARKKIYKENYDKNNKEKISKYGYSLRARPEYQNRIREWRTINKEHLRLKSKEWRIKNKEYKKKIDREYRINNKEKVNLNKRKYYSNNKDKVNNMKKKYNSSFKGKINRTKRNHKVLSLKHKVKFDLTSEQIKELFNKYDSCIYCGRKDKLSLDHLHPITKNGDTSINNIVISCRPCNASKGDRDVEEWCNEKGYLIPKNKL